MISRHNLPPIDANFLTNVKNSVQHIGNKTLEEAKAYIEYELRLRDGDGVSEGTAEVKPWKKED